MEVVVNQTTGTTKVPVEQLTVDHLVQVQNKKNGKSKLGKKTKPAQTASEHDVKLGDHLFNNVTKETAKVKKVLPNGDIEVVNFPGSADLHCRGLIRADVAHSNDPGAQSASWFMVEDGTELTWTYELAGEEITEMVTL